MQTYHSVPSREFKIHKENVQTPMHGKSLKKSSSRKVLSSVSTNKSVLKKSAKAKGLSVRYENAHGVTPLTNKVSTTQRRALGDISNRQSSTSVREAKSSVLRKGTPMKLKFEPLQDLGTKSRNVQQTIQYDTVDDIEESFGHSQDTIDYVKQLQNEFIHNFNQNVDAEEMEDDEDDETNGCPTFDSSLLDPISSESVGLMDESDDVSFGIEAPDDFSIPLDMDCFSMIDTDEFDVKLLTVSDDLDVEGELSHAFSSQLIVE